MSACNHHWFGGVVCACPARACAQGAARRALGRAQPATAQGARNLGNVYYDKIVKQLASANEVTVSTPTRVRWGVAVALCSGSARRRCLAPRQPWQLAMY
jgi:hypothetical protein